MRSTCFIILFFSLLSFNLLSTSSSPVDDVPPLVEKRDRFAFYAAINFTQMFEDHHGYIELPYNHGAKMFYYFFQADAENLPLVLWLSGGPGLTTNIAVFYENGPFMFDEGGSLIKNNDGWNQISNIIYVDQPIGTGFSYADSVANIRDNQVDIANDLYYFLQGFLAIYDGYSDRDLYITGEAFAAHYASSLALKILLGNKYKHGSYNIQLKGVAIGNPLIDISLQYETIPQFAITNNRLGRGSDCSFLEELVDICQKTTKNCANIRTDDFCRTAYRNCHHVVKEIIRLMGNTNSWDIRKLRHSDDSMYDYSRMLSFLSDPSVSGAIGVESFELQSQKVLEALKGDMARNIQAEISTLLDRNSGVKFLIYAGRCDLINNSVGVLRALLGIEWYGKDGFANSAMIPFTVDHNKVGELKTYGRKLTYIEIFKAGRMVPMYQPRIASEMIRRWMSGEF